MCCGLVQYMFLCIVQIFSLATTWTGQPHFGAMMITEQRWMFALTVADLKITDCFASQISIAYDKFEMDCSLSYA